MISAYIDRFEEEYAVILLGDDFLSADFPRAYLPEDVNEGDYIKIHIERDTAATEAAEAEARALLSSR